MGVDFVVLVAEVATLWRLGQIRYWNGFPCFYTKLLLATIVYLAPNVRSDAWWKGWWATLDPALLALMLLSAVEATRRIYERVSGEERRFAGFMIICAGVCGAAAAAMLPAPAYVLPQNAAYIWFARAVQSGISTAYLVPLIHHTVAPFRVAPVALLHFVFLAIMTIGFTMTDLAANFVTTSTEWYLARWAGQTIYVAMLICWSMLTRRAICASEV